MQSRYCKPPVVRPPATIRSLTFTFSNFNSEMASVIQGTQTSVLETREASSNSVFHSLLYKHRQLSAGPSSLEGAYINTLINASPNPLSTNHASNNLMSPLFALSPRLFPRVSVISCISVNALFTPSSRKRSVTFL